jgi:flagellar hook-associated protein 2
MVDIVNTLNAGSGIDIKSLAKSLTDTVRAPQQQVLETKTKALEAKISSVGKIMSTVTSFDDAIKALGDPETFQRSPSSSDPTKVAMEFVDGKIAPTFSGQVAVNQLATDASVLLPGMTSLDAPLAGIDNNRTLKIISGSSTSPGSVMASIDLTQVKTLPALRDRINEISGFQATIIQGGTAGSPRYYLGVKGGMGAANTFHLSINTDPGLGPVAATGSGLFLNGTEVVKAGTDAEITIDGVTVTSSTNDFTDILPGIKITALARTASDVTLSSKYNTQSLTDAMATLVSGFNLMLDTVKIETKFDTDPTKRGGLASDASTRALLSELRRFTTQEIFGFNDEAHTLAELGVRTNRDGSLSLDQNYFAKVLKENTALVEAVLASKKQVSDTRLSIISSDQVAPAKYTVTKVAVGQWQINGQLATLSTGKLTANAGTSADGLVLSLPPSVETAAPIGYQTNIYFAKGLVERFSDMFVSLKDSQSSLQIASNNASKLLTELAVKKIDLDTRMTKMEERYLLQFAQMNALVNESSNTKTSLKTFIDSWTAGLKG